MTFLGIAFLCGSVAMGCMALTVKIQTDFSLRVLLVCCFAMVIHLAASLGFAYLSFRCFGGEL
jgi:hypothetical protein